MRHLSEEQGSFFWGQGKPGEVLENLGEVLEKPCEVLENPGEAQVMLCEVQGTPYVVREMLCAVLEKLGAGQEKPGGVRGIL